MDSWNDAVWLAILALVWWVGFIKRDMKDSQTYVEHLGRRVADLEMQVRAMQDEKDKEHEVVAR